MSHHVSFTRPTVSMHNCLGSCHDSSARAASDVNSMTVRGRPFRASSIAETTDLGRRVIALADQLGARTDRRRAVSFRLLAKQLETPKAASSLWRAVAIYRLAERYPELYTYQHLGVAHLSVLLSLRGPVQLALLRKAERMRWSRRKLEAKVKRLFEEEARGVDSLEPLLDELRNGDSNNDPVVSRIGSLDRRRSTDAI